MDASTNSGHNDPAPAALGDTSNTQPQDTENRTRSGWRPWGARGGRGGRGGRAAGVDTSDSSSITDPPSLKARRKKWTMGMLNDTETDEVPGSILLLSKASNRNEPLGLQNAPARRSSSSIPIPYPSSQPHSRAPSIASRPPQPETKKTADGGIVLEPQPDESMNDPLNWATWKRDSALLSLGFYCMLGGGMTPVLAAGFGEVAEAYDVSLSRVALTTGLYMMGLGLGSVVASPTAILFGKRPVYLVSGVIFILTAIWCALSPNYVSLLIARIFMGFAVSPVECLPSATVAEIFFLHERAYRLGIYTLLLLGGKNLIPLVSAAIIESLGWRWVFWIVAMVVGFGLALLFLFVPETFWDRTPRPHHWDQHHDRPQRPRQASMLSLASIFRHERHHDVMADPHPSEMEKDMTLHSPTQENGPEVANKRPSRHAHFGDDIEKVDLTEESLSPHDTSTVEPAAVSSEAAADASALSTEQEPEHARPLTAEGDTRTSSHTPETHAYPGSVKHNYTNYYRGAPPKSFVQTLRPFSGRLCQDNWFRVAFRPFILFAYPAILWSAMVYALSVGWLIVLSESVSTIYESRDTYNFTSLQAGLVYISPFVGGILGTAVAGKVSDLIVRYVSRKNDGIYEPEFRLIMAIPVAISTTIGLMGYGWSAQERDAWIVPTVFFAIISFGCCLGSTTAITFAVDSYRQYAGEALVTLNFAKNIFHGLVFSLFFNRWLTADGSKTVFLSLGGIQLACLLFTIPMYIYGKRARMWTVRKNLMEKF
ncbi:hypothetical protein AAFC00_005835 [Neodothiora populina]|uniref:Major facilitator superfamily (MFS) profile domain-containing protein n=1 Tax=Neodothiora populina TaxID=2781224 RepID=A0ABR3P6B5_9PEZI